MPFFYIGLPQCSGMVNGAGAGNFRRIARHPLVGRCRSAQQPLCLCRDGKEEIGGQVPSIALPGRPPIGFASARFPHAISSPVCAIRPSAGPAPLVLLPSLGARGGTGLQGLASLDC